MARNKVKLELLTLDLQRIRDKVGYTQHPVEYVPLDVYENWEYLKGRLRAWEVDTVINLGSPYINIRVMDACLHAGCNYLDTACYEAKNTKGFSYKEQLGYVKAFEEEGLTAILGAGGTPGVSNLMAARMHRELPELNILHIADINAGSQHKFPFCTNFSPEDNLKSLTYPVCTGRMENGYFKMHFQIESGT